MPSHLRHSEPRASGSLPQVKGLQILMLSSLLSNSAKPVWPPGEQRSLTWISFTPKSEWPPTSLALASIRPSTLGANGRLAASQKARQTDTTKGEARERERALPLSVSASPISSSDQKLMGHEFPERRKKVPPTEPAREISPAASSGVDRGTKRFIPCLTLSLSLSVRVKVQPRFRGQSSSSARLESP